MTALKVILGATLICWSMSASDAVEAPTPLAPVPSARQLAWHELEFYGFLHFSLNTFTDKEWGYGNESPALFNPTDFDAEQIAHTCAEAGMKGLILTAKHHDGFCLWPSKLTDHSVKNSPWKGGKGDVVKEISDACRRHGLKFGIYLSPWDRNRADYGTSDYLVYFRQQLRELLTNYGPVFEVWFDGANGGDGHYGGAREQRKIDRKRYYDWANTWNLVRELQPNACLFSDAGPDVRWVGNERGEAGETCWATLNAADFAPGEADEKRLNRGDPRGTHWLPAEADVSIRPGWFYHPRDDAKVKSATNLVALYFKSVGRGASFLLNLPPDQRGRIHENDVRSLREFRQQIDSLFARNLVGEARVNASNSRGNDPRFAVEYLLDDHRDTYWATDDSVTNAEVIVEFRQPERPTVLRLREFLPLGQRIEAYALDAWVEGSWKEFSSGRSIGNCRLVRCEGLVTDKVRLRILRAAACPALAEFSVFGVTTRDTTAGP